MENFQCLCLPIIIQNAYHITANNRGFPHLRKNEAKFKVETRIGTNLGQMIKGWGKRYEIITDEVCKEKNVEFSGS